MIMLTGLVTKNAILLVDFVGQIRKLGIPTAVAIAEAGRRFRPVALPNTCPCPASFASAQPPSTPLSLIDPLACNGFVSTTPLDIPSLFSDIGYHGSDDVGISFW